MSYNHEVIQKSLDLAATMQTGIEYIRSRFAEGKFEETLPLLQDFTLAFISIQQALQFGKEETYAQCFADHNERIQSGLSELVTAYEMADWTRVVRALENEVVPGFDLWKTELEQYYGPRAAI
ncbi:MAG: hypothetical protein ACOX4Q_10680 [Syntrophomonadales bacterium]|jgi:hypothetical protein